MIAAGDRGERNFPRGQQTGVVAPDRAAANESDFHEACYFLRVFEQLQVLAVAFLGELRRPG